MSPMGKHNSSANGEYQKREASHKHDMHQIDAIFRNESNQPGCSDEQPERYPHAKCEGGTCEWTTVWPNRQQHKSRNDSCSKPGQHWKIPRVFENDRQQQRNSCESVELRFQRERTGRLRSNEVANILEVWKLGETQQARPQESTDSKNQQQHHAFRHQPLSHEVEHWWNPLHSNPRIDDSGDQP